MEVCPFTQSFSFRCLFLPYFEKIAIYCWVDKDSFPVIGWRSPGSILRPSGNSCTITESLYPLDYGASRLSHLGMFVTTGCSSRRQFVATASRQDTSSKQQNTDSGRQVTASGQFYKPSQTQESKYSSYALLLPCRLKWKNGSTFNERNFV